MKIYLCGPTSQDIKATTELFDRWQERLTKYLKHVPDVHIINPMNIDSNSVPWGDYKEERLNLVRDCDILFIIEGFTSSSIASDEFMLAVDLKKFLFRQNQLFSLHSFCMDAALSSY